jgi:hypothetical protein
MYENDYFAFTHLHVYLVLFSIPILWNPNRRRH